MCHASGVGDGRRWQLTCAASFLTAATASFFAADCFFATCCFFAAGSFVAVESFFAASRRPCPWADRAGRGGVGVR
eukprot:scaffold46249_cov62-Phaeocystis_antarctica.AAC.3